MTSAIATRIVLAATLALVGAIILVIMIAPSSNDGFTDAAAALTFISAAAIGIERAIETFWTFFGGLKGSYWPLSAIEKQVQTLVGELDNSLNPFHEQAIARIEQLKKAGNVSQDKLKKLESAPADIERLKRRFDELRNLAPGNQRVQLLAAAAAQNVAYLSEKYGDVLEELNEAATIANSAIGGLQDFLATFKDNPGRRLISLYTGAILGLIIAGLFGLDIVQATLGSSRFPVLSIILTGIIMGLGSNPTHEVIRVVQEFKESRKGQNTQQPDLPQRNRG